MYNILHANGYKSTSFATFAPRGMQNYLNL